MDVKFPYRFEGKNFFGKIYRPYALVSFNSSKYDRWITTWMVVDSGADFSIVPKFLSEDLGIHLESDCIKDTTTGVGGEQSIYLCKSKILVKIGHLQRIVPLAFFDSDKVPPLLGRLGFLETFDAKFLKTQVIVFKD